jgi:steroid 5-alpha reductase family enzyme
MKTVTAVLAGFSLNNAMAFQDKHSPSIPVKFLLSLSVLAGTVIAMVLTTGYSDWLISFLEFERVEGDAFRLIIMFICCLIYFLRFTVDLFVFMQRKISWYEGGLVSVLFFLMFYIFTISAGSHTEPIGLIDIAGILMFLIGSYINTTAGYQRYVWKKDADNKGHLYTVGLFKYSMHINYFGDAIAYIGLALITREMLCLVISGTIIVNFIFIQIPLLDKHLGNKYKKEFAEYSRVTKKFVPFVY